MSLNVLVVSELSNAILVHLCVKNICSPICHFYNVLSRADDVFYTILVTLNLYLLPKATHLGVFLHVL